MGCKRNHKKQKYDNHKLVNTLSCFHYLLIFFHHLYLFEKSRFIYLCLHSVLFPRAHYAVIPNVEPVCSLLLTQNIFHLRKEPIWLSVQKSLLYLCVSKENLFQNSHFHCLALVGTSVFIEQPNV